MYKGDGEWADESNIMSPPKRRHFVSIMLVFIYYSTHLTLLTSFEKPIIVKGREGVCDIFISLREYPTPVLGPLMGVAGGGGGMSHVDFKKWQCRMSLSLIFPNVICRI